MGGDGDDTVISSDDTVITQDDTVISSDDTIISLPVEQTVIEPDLDDTAFTGPGATPVAVDQRPPVVLPPRRRVTDGPAAPPRPTVTFALRLVSGARYSLASAVVLGRAPRVVRQRAEDAVQLVTVPSREGRVSSTHAELRQVGDVVVVTDLRSTNGTRVSLPSGVSRQLAPGDSMSLGEGAIVDIGDGNRIEVLRENPREASNDIAR